MSIINFSPYRQYLYSPLSCIHQINTILKICLIILYLLMIPFIPELIFLLIFIYFLTYILFFQYLLLKSKYINQFLNKGFRYIILLILFIISSNKIINTNHKIIQINYPSILQKDSSS